MFLLNQDLEYPGFEVEDQVWNRLLELRGSKIRKELELKKQQRTFAVMKRKLEALQADCDSVDSQVSRKFLVVFSKSHGGAKDSKVSGPLSAIYEFSAAISLLPLSFGAMRSRLVNPNSSVNWSGWILHLFVSFSLLAPCLNPFTFPEHPAPISFLTTRCGVA